MEASFTGHIRFMLIHKVVYKPLITAAQFIMQGKGGKKNTLVKHCIPEVSLQGSKWAVVFIYINYVVEQTDDYMHRLDSLSEGWERWDIINTDKHSESSAFGNERQRRSDKRGRDQRGTRRLQREALVEVTQGPDGREYSCTVSGVVEHCRFLVAALIHG